MRNLSHDVEFSLETAVSPIIQNVVQRFWQVERHDGKSIKETIIPKGTVEIIFNLTADSDATPVKIAKNDHKIPRCFISGFHTVPVFVQAPGRQLLFGAYVNPTALCKIFRINGKDYVNQCIDLTLVDSSLNSLWNRLADQKTFHERVEIFNDWLVKRVPDISNHDKLFDTFLTQSLGRSISADEVSKILCYSPRHLSRKLFQLTAMNLEQSLTYKRYVRAIDLIHNSRLLLTEIAHACNFADQSHFTKTFRSFASMKPTEYRMAKSHVTGHIFQDVR